MLRSRFNVLNVNKVFRLQRRTIVRPTQSSSVKDQDLNEDIWIDWFKQNKWKQHLGTQETTDLDAQFLQQDFLVGDDIKYSTSQDENFEEFTKDVINILHKSDAQNSDTRYLEENDDMDDETYHDTFKIFNKKTLAETDLLDEMQHITKLRERLLNEDKRGSSYEVILPSGDVVDYDKFKDSISAKGDRLRRDPYKLDHKNQLIDHTGRTVARGSAKTARASVMVMENKNNEGMTYVNGEHYTTYFQQPSYRLNAVLPLLTTGTFRKYDIFAYLRGGGKSGQSQAMRLGLARALAFRDPSLRLHLQPYGFLFRDGKHKVRKYPMFKSARKRRPYKRR